MKRTRSPCPERSSITPKIDADRLPTAGRADIDTMSRQLPHFPPFPGAALHLPLLTFLTAIAFIALMPPDAAAQPAGQTPASDEFFAPADLPPRHLPLPPELLPPGSRRREPVDSESEQRPHAPRLRREPPLSPADEDATQLQQTPAVKLDDLPQLVADLSSPQWSIREMAELRLRAMNPAMLANLHPLLAATSDAEALWRLERVYRTLVPQSEYAPPESLRAGFLGITFEMVSSEEEPRLAPRRSAARVSMLVGGGPAGRGGVQVGDLLTAIDGQEFVGDFQSGHLPRMLISRGAGRIVRLSLLRDGRPLTVTLELGGRSPEQEIEMGWQRGGVHPFDEQILEHQWRRYWAERRAGGFSGGASGDSPADEE
jgi:hypothetical protein